MAIPTKNIDINGEQVEVIDVYGDDTLVILTQWLSAPDNKYMQQVDDAVADTDLDFADFGAAFDDHKLTNGRTAYSIYNTFLVEPEAYAARKRQYAVQQDTVGEVTDLKDQVADLETRVGDLENPA